MSESTFDAMARHVIVTSAGIVANGRSDWELVYTGVADADAIALMERIASAFDIRLVVGILEDPDGDNKCFSYCFVPMNSRFGE